MNPKLNSARAVRRAFLDYFEAGDHRVVRSASLVPADDPSLMFTNAGMVQFKDVFTGQRELPYARATSSQKCLRVSGKHNDLEVVGRTPRHHTFFEMLGNFSFGDYFKAEAISLAWSFLTEPEYCGLPKDRLWVSVHESDDEAYALWRDQIQLPESRLLRLGDKDNFWSMGETGPCGPCSEIHWDKGEEYGDDYENRLLEIWNLVFMQYERSADGSVQDLPNPSIDTGMGLERLASVLQGVDSNYETDLLRAIIARGEEVSGRAYGADSEDSLALRVITDHARATAFLMADGILPGNEGRGYVLRRIMRRAIRFATRFDLAEPFFHEICLSVCDQMGEDYPELEEARCMIQQAVPQEEELFRRTLDRGMRLIQGWSGGASSGEIMPGDVTFRLYDTYGFPIDLTRLIAEEQGFEIDLEGFGKALEAQRNLGRAARKGPSRDSDQLYRELLGELGATSFVGYDQLSLAKAPVAALIKDGRRVSCAEPGDELDLLVPVTPFYGEAGGQVGDTGLVRGSQALAEVATTLRPLGQLFVHRLKLKDGSLKEGDLVELAVDGQARERTARNHSGTHLLHYALRQILGPHVRQRGSLVTPGRLRFDFTHFEPVTRENLAKVEAMANQLVMANTVTDCREVSYDDAIGAGALAFFGDKYGDQVRMVQIGGPSLELCGGTHVGRSGDIGFIKVVSEGGVSAGVRRIEAVTGEGALALMQRFDDVLRSAARQLRTTPLEAADRVTQLVEQQKELERRVEQLNKQLAAGSVDGLLAQAQERQGVKLLATKVEGVAPKELRDLGDRLRDRLGTGALLLAAEHDGKAALLCMVSRDLTDRVRAGDLVRMAAEAVGGRGGGRPDMAQAGGPDVAGIPLALERFTAHVEGVLGE